MNRRIAGLFLVTALLLGSALVPAGLSLGGGSGSAAAAPPPPAATTVATAPVGGIHPPISCPTMYPEYLELLGGVWPLDPDFYQQNPCPLIEEDEIHATFSSPVAGSGDHWSVPWYLPADGPGGQANAFSGVYLGEIVSGDPHSAYNESYLELLADPVGSGSGLTWSLSVAVLSFANASRLPAASRTCGLGENLSWNDSFFCEFDDLVGNTSIPVGTVAAGAWYSFALDGTPGGTDGLTLWVNGTGSSPVADNLTLNRTTTGTWAFEPKFAAACPDACDLDWGLSYGLGFGVDVCPQYVELFAACDTYNGTMWATLPPIQLGDPEFFENGSYSGDYTYFSPESASGVCNNAPVTGVDVAACEEFATAGGDGTYPWFSLDGNGTTSTLSFGIGTPTTRSNFGEATGQYLSSSDAADLVPIALTQLVDSSQGGFVAPGSSVNVSVRATDLGRVANVTLAYSEGGSAWTTSLLPLTGGTSEDGSYAGTIPSGPDGTIVYVVNATGTSGKIVSSGPRDVVRGPLPLFSVLVEVAPPTCGSVTIGTAVATNNTTLSLYPGTYSLVASGCYSYHFASWQATSHLLVAGTNDPSASVTVEGNGTIVANWQYYRVTTTVTFTVTPSGCGYVTLNGTALANATASPLLYGIDYGLTANVTCAAYAFGGWVVAGNLSVIGPTLTPYGNGSLLAQFVPTSTAGFVTFATVPATCGGVSLGGAVYTSGESLALPFGEYTVAPAPCRHYGFEGFGTAGAVSISGTTLDVTGDGELTEVNYRLTELYVTTSPGYCGGILLNGTEYTNGADIVVQNHSSYTLAGISCAGHYLESVTVGGNLTLAGSFLTVNGSGTVLVVSLAGTPKAYIGFLTNPANCGMVDLDGTPYADGGFLAVPPDSVLPIAADACPEYGFLSWQVSGAIAIENGTAWVNGSGSIEAVFSPLVGLVIDTIPATCGSVAIASVTYTNGEEAVVTEGLAYPIVTTPCAHYELSSYEASGSAPVANGTIVVNDPATLTAVFVPTPYSVTISLAGLGCGSVAIDRVDEGNGAVVTDPFGTYPIAALPCATSEFVGWTTGGNVSIAGGTLYLNGSGSIGATFALVPPSVSLSAPGLAFVGTPVLLYATVAVPVSATGYTFVWSFGDGATNTTASNSTTHAYGSAGSYRVSVEVIDPYHRTANASAVVAVQGASSGASLSAAASGLFAAGVAAVAIAALWLVGGRRERPKAPPAAPSRGGP